MNAPALALRHRRALLAGALVVLLLATAVTYGWWRHSESSAATAGFPLDGRDDVVLVGEGSRVEVRHTDGELVARGPVCQRSYAAGGTLACLRSTGVPFQSTLTVFRGDLDEPVVTLDLWGNPSRVRVSPSGGAVGWTVFRSGDSYAKSGTFSTTAGLYVLDTDEHHGSLEDYTVERADGSTWMPEDRNFWGVTFVDDDSFYATVGSGDETWLARGDVGSRTLTQVRPGVECPSLSPDGTRIAYKARVGDGWRPHVLTLATGADVALAETESIDDQIAWVDDTTVAYAKPDSAGGGPAVFTVPADGSGSPSRWAAGSSPAFR